MTNYTKTTIGKENRIELHEKLSLTGAEISLNELPAGANVPFVHSHKENEEIYGLDFKDVDRITANNALKVFKMAE